MKSVRRRNVFTFDEIEAIAETLLKKGMHPAAVRRRLSEQGLHWEYQFLGAGRRERMRRLRQAGQTLCRCGEAMTMVTGREMCDTCLEKKWSPSSPAPLSLPSSD